MGASEEAYYSLMAMNDLFACSLDHNNLCQACNNLRSWLDPDRFDQKRTRAVFYPTPKITLKKD